MKTVTVSGIICFEYDQFNKVKLVQPDGSDIDLVDWFEELSRLNSHKAIQVGYWLANEPCTRDEAVMGFLEKLYGYGIEAEYDAQEYCYSSWTAGCDYYTKLRIGGHDLYEEILDKEGKFIIVELNFLE